MPTKLTRRKTKKPHNCRDKSTKKDYVGPWTVRFKCGRAVFVSSANSYDIGDLAKKLHIDFHPECIGFKCRPIEFIKERIKRCRQNTNTRKE